MQCMHRKSLYLQNCYEYMIYTSYLFRKNGQTLPQRVKCIYWSCVMISKIENGAIFTKCAHESHKTTELIRKASLACVSHSWWFAITSPVVGKPVQVQEEWHRLCFSVEYFLTVHTCHFMNVNRNRSHTKQHKTTVWTIYVSPCSFTEGDGGCSRGSI